jgi:hypothetical protein
VNRQDGIPGVVLFVEQGAEFAVREVFFEANEGRLNLGPDILTLRQELRQDLDLVLLLLDLAEEVEVPLEQLLFLLEGLGSPLVLPDLGRGQALVDGFPLGFFVIEVKESPAALRTCRSSRRVAS